MTTTISSSLPSTLPRRISLSRTGRWLLVSRRSEVDLHDVLGTMPARTLPRLDGPVEFVGREIWALDGGALTRILPGDLQVLAERVAVPGTTRILAGFGEGCCDAVIAGDDARRVSVKTGEPVLHAIEGLLAGEHVVAVYGSRLYVASRGTLRAVDRRLLWKTGHLDGDVLAASVLFEGRALAVLLRGRNGEDAILVLSNERRVHQLAVPRTRCWAVAEQLGHAFLLGEDQSVIRVDQPGVSTTRAQSASEPSASPASSQNPRPAARTDWDAEAALTVQKLLDRPMPPAARAELEMRWQRIQAAVERLRVEQGSADPAAVARARAEVDGFRQASSSTIHSNAADPEAALASKNWQQADHMVHGWAASREPLTLSRIQEINFTLQQGLKRQGTPGELRTQAVTAGGQISKMYVSPKELESRMAAFLDWYNSNASTMPPIELAAGAYQRLVSIHPFGDANGRTCRLVMDWILERHGLPPATFSGEEHNVAVYWSDAYNGGGVTTEQAVAAVTKAVERTIELTSRATQQGLHTP